MRGWMVRKLILAVALIAMGGCSSKYRIDAIQRPAAPVDSKGSAYVMASNDGSYGGKMYVASGRSLSHATVAELSKYMNRVDIAEGAETIEEALAKAKVGGYKYVVQPSILHWEDRNTKWSGRPDRITIKLVLWEVESEKNLSSNVSSASSKWATFGGDHPEDLLPGALSSMVPTLF
jgi:hypothetical protein